MTGRMLPGMRIKAIFFILAVISISHNTNKKYVKSEPVRESLPGKIEREDLCKLGSHLVVGQIMAVEKVQVVPVEMLSAENFPYKRPRAVVHGLKRSLLGSGAHREVHSVFDLEVEVGTHEIPVGENCELVILEHLSAGVFADPFQLQRLQQRKAVKEVYIYGDVDLERPAKTSFQSIVEVHQQLWPGKEDSNAFFHSEVTLPLHARYPPTNPESHSVLMISMPHVLIYCRGQDNVTDTSTHLSQDLCIYALWGNNFSKVPAQTLQWFIPSGYPAHLDWVTNLTSLAAITGVAAIIGASKFSRSRHDSK